jgi:hypothetical protein
MPVSRNSRKNPNPLNLRAKYALRAKPRQARLCEGFASPFGVFSEHAQCDVKG